MSILVTLIEMNDNTLDYNAYKDVVSQDSGLYHNIKLLLEKINFSHVWASQGTFSKSKLLHAITVKLKDSYVTFWRECIFDDDRTNLPTGNGNKLRTYRTFKTSYSLENYLLSSSNSKIEIQVFAKIRISSHKLVDIENCHCKREYVSSVK